MGSFFKLNTCVFQDATSYTDEEFASLMNKIIQKASEMRVVMNKLEISDTGDTPSKYFFPVTLR